MCKRSLPRKQALCLGKTVGVKNAKTFLQKIGIPHHEYWPWWTLVAPVWPLWLWYGIRLKNLTWFTAVNPGIEDGGFMGESKKSIQDIIPQELLPETFYFNHLEAIELNRFDNKYPLVAKPDIGGRGRKIKILNSNADWIKYHDSIGEDYMLQEMINSPLEVGVYYTRIPGEEKGQVVSLSSKNFLKIKGDGISSIKTLMFQKICSQKQLERSFRESLDLEQVPEEGIEVVLEPIGNHCRGAKFINDNHRITNQLNESFDEISKKIDGFYYGRFDIKVTNWEDLENGKNISILELNGLTSDPTHIFDPNYKLADVFKTQRKHIKIAYQIARVNLKAGHKTTPAWELAKKSFSALRMM